MLIKEIKWKQILGNSQSENIVILRIYFIKSTLWSIYKVIPFTQKDKIIKTYKHWHQNVYGMTDI